MSTISKPMLRQASLLCRVYQTNVTRQLLLPFSTSVQHFAEPTVVKTSTDEPPAEDANQSKSFDSVPVHLGRVAKTVMVLGGRYSRYRDVPDTMPNRIYQRTKDKFRARCVVLSLFGTALLGYVAAVRGKNAHKEGKRYTDSIFEMHRGGSRLHNQLETMHQRTKRPERYSENIDEINK